MCYLINDLVNRELIRKDFKFLQPIFDNDKEEKKEVKAIEDEDDEERIEAAEDEYSNINLAKYLREGQGDIELSPEKVKQAEAEQEYPETPVDPREWENEYKRAREKLKDGTRIKDKDKYIYNTHKLTRYFQTLKDIMALAGNASLNTYISQCENVLMSISKHEKRLNSYISQDLVSL